MAPKNFRSCPMHMNPDPDCMDCALFSSDHYPLTNNEQNSETLVITSGSTNPFASAPTFLDISMADAQMRTPTSEVPPMILTQAPMLFESANPANTQRPPIYRPLPPLSYSPYHIAQGWSPFPGINNEIPENDDDDDDYPEQLALSDNESLTKRSRKLKRKLAVEFEEGIKQPSQKQKISQSAEPVELDKSLSEIAKHQRYTPVLVDLEAFVNRSSKERQEEVKRGKTPSKVGRPMNSFMLYRKSYQHVANAMSQQRNNRTISQIIGHSWQVESKEVKNRFTALAKTDMQSHKNAFPGYKFQSSSNEKTKRKPSNPSSTDESSNDEPSPSKGRPSKVNKNPAAPKAADIIDESSEKDTIEAEVPTSPRKKKVGVVRKDVIYEDESSEDDS